MASEASLGYIVKLYLNKWIERGAGEGGSSVKSRTVLTMDSSLVPNINVKQLTTFCN